MTLDGEELLIEWRESDDRVYMNGPVELESDIGGSQIRRQTIHTSGIFSSFRWPSVSSTCSNPNRT